VKYYGKTTETLKNFVKIYEVESDAFSSETLFSVQQTKADL